MVVEIREGDDVLVNALEDAKTVTHLKLELFGLEAESLEAFMPFLADVIAQNPPLRRLELSYGPLNAEAMFYLSRALKRNTNIEELVLHGVELDNEGARFLAGALIINPDLRIVDLSNNSIGDEAVDDLLYALSRNRGLQILDLSNNSISAAQVERIVTVFAEQGERDQWSVGTIDVSNNSDLTPEQEEEIERVFHERVRGNNLPASLLEEIEPVEDTNKLPNLAAIGG